MAGPADYGDLITTTIENRTKTIKDNLSINTALLAKLKMKGKMRTFSGGRTIDEELVYSGPGNSGYYSGYDQLGMSQGEMLTMAEFAIKQAAVTISMSGLEELQNAGAEQFIDLYAARLDAGSKELVNLLSDGLYSDGTGSGGKQIGGLQLLIADDGTGTVGGINASTYSWWANQFYDFSANSVVPSAATITSAMNTLYLACSRNRDQPDLIVADDTYYTYYEESLQPIQRIADSKMADAGFQNLKYKGAAVIPDGALNGSAPASHMYFLNTDFISWRPHAKRNVVQLNPERFTANQDAMSRIIAWAGNATVSGRKFQGAIVA